MFINGVFPFEKAEEGKYISWRRRAACRCWERSCPVAAESVSWFVVKAVQERHCLQSSRPTCHQES